MEFDTRQEVTGRQIWVSQNKNLAITIVKWKQAALQDDEFPITENFQRQI